MAPVFLADMQSTDGGDTATLRYDNKDPYSVDLMVEEEASNGDEIAHTTETIGYMLLSPSQLSLPIDSDGDGLSDDIDSCPNDAANDADGDGVCVEDGDCDDYDPSVNPGTTEVCDDFVDNNCDGILDEGCYVCTDLDGDNYCAEVDDCDDYDPSVNPGTAEICDDGLDNNCDGLIDGADTDCGACVFTGREKGKKCNDGLDNDCNGLTDNEDPSCGTLLSEDKLSEGKGKTCRDGLDNDGDGQTDCDDIDCAFNRSCK